MSVFTACIVFLLDSLLVFCVFTFFPCCCCFCFIKCSSFSKNSQCSTSKYPKQIQNHLELISYRCSVKSLFRRKHQWGLENTKKALKFSYKSILVLLPWKTRGVLQFPKVSRSRLLSFRRLGNLSDL